MLAVPTSQSLMSTFAILIDNAEKYEVGSQALEPVLGESRGSILMVPSIPSRRS